LTINLIAGTHITANHLVLSGCAVSFFLRKSLSVLSNASLKTLQLSPSELLLLVEITD
jgi:hypothetical protein